MTCRFASPLRASTLPRHGRWRRSYKVGAPGQARRQGSREVAGAARGEWERKDYRENQSRTASGSGKDAG